MTQIAIASGFAVTVCWPATSWLVNLVVWPGACLAYAGAAVLVVAIVLPQDHGPAELIPARVPPPPPAVGAPEGPRLLGERLLAYAFSASGALTNTVLVHLLLLLEAEEYSAAATVALSALIGPAQAGAHVLELFFGRGAHPIWAMLVSGGVAPGLFLLVVAPSLAWLAIALYGARNRRPPTSCCRRPCTG